MAVYECDSFTSLVENSKIAGVGDTVILTKDIDRYAEIGDISEKSLYMTGYTLDGNGHTISNIDLNVKDSGYSFIHVNYNGMSIIKNVIFRNFYSSNGSQSYSIFSSANTSYYKAKIQNCEFYGTFKNGPSLGGAGFVTYENCRGYFTGTYMPSGACVYCNFSVDISGSTLNVSSSSSGNSYNNCKIKVNCLSKNLKEIGATAIVGSNNVFYFYGMAEPTEENPNRIGFNTSNSTINNIVASDKPLTKRTSDSSTNLLTTIENAVNEEWLLSNGFEVIT